MSVDQQEIASRRSARPWRSRVSSSALVVICSVVAIAVTGTGYALLPHVAATAVASTALIVVVGAGSLTLLRQQRRLYALSHGIMIAEKENLQKITRAEYHTRESTRLLSSQIYRIGKGISSDSAQLTSLIENLEALKRSLEATEHERDRSVQPPEGGVEERIQHQRNTQALERFLAQLLAAAHRPDLNTERE